MPTCGKIHLGYTESNKTSQGYVRKHILKTGGYFFGEYSLTQRPFEKPAITYAQQVDLLKQRGMSFNDAALAEFYLEHLNYYRLVAYWLPFEADHVSHQFKSGTRFDDVLELYVFDRELRLLALDAIERIEVSVRAHWAYELAHRYGPHGHLDAALAQDADYWNKNLIDLQKAVRRADEIFIHHLTQTYCETLPPVWAVCEVMSLGLLSKWYMNLKPMDIRDAISEAYGIDEGVFGSWLHHLSTIRNICAHHGRLWNRKFKRTAKAPVNKPRRLQAEIVRNSRQLYNSLVILLHLMDVIAPQHLWRARLKTHLIEHAHLLAPMGFPADWATRPIWQPYYPPQKEPHA